VTFTITATASTGGRAANTPGASRSTVVRSPRRPRSQRLDDGGLQRLVPQPLQRAAIHEEARLRRTAESKLQVQLAGLGAVTRCKPEVGRLRRGRGVGRSRLDQEMTVVRRPGHDHERRRHSGQCHRPRIAACRRHHHQLPRMRDSGRRASTKGGRERRRADSRRGASLRRVGRPRGRCLAGRLRDRSR
jgi:hypothetical protein